jgi:hypothetical protein
MDGTVRGASRIRCTFILARFAPNGGETSGIADADLPRGAADSVGGM